MKLSQPITVQPPSVTTDGVTTYFPPVTLSELSFVLMDSAKYRVVHAQIGPIPRTLVLWAGDAYDNIGDYTQDQAEARILELLGDDPKSVLESLFLPPVR